MSLLMLGVIFAMTFISEKLNGLQYLLSGKLLYNPLAAASIGTIVWLVLLLSGAIHLVTGLSLRSPLRKVAERMASELIP
jgi:hypothetical protein